MTLALRGRRLASRTFRIKGGKVARAETQPVFRLTDIVAMESSKDALPGQPAHPEVVALQLPAANRRQVLDGLTRSTLDEETGNG